MIQESTSAFVRAINTDDAKKSNSYCRTVSVKDEEGRVKMSSQSKIKRRPIW